MTVYDDITDRPIDKVDVVVQPEGLKPGEDPAILMNQVVSHIEGIRDVKTFL